MSVIPSNLARVPNMLTSQVILSSLQGTSKQLLQQQIQIATGKQILRPSDDAGGASTVSVLDDMLERRDQRLRNLSHGSSVLNTLDSALAEATELLVEAKSIGIGQIGVGSDAETRANQAKVIDSILQEMMAIGNRDSQGIHLFGGDATAAPPFVEALGGIRYVGLGDGMETDMRLTSTPITIDGASALGAMSTRVQGERDLDPTMDLDTRLVDLAGARGIGVALGSVEVNVSGTPTTVDLSEAHTARDVKDAIEAAVPGALVEIDPVTDNRFRITAPAGDTVTISDLGADATAADLGLAGVTFTDGGTDTGGDLDPRLTDLTPVSFLAGVTTPLGTVRISNGGQVRDVDLSGVTNIEELRNEVASLGIGVRVEIAETGDRLDFVNELSGASMSIGEFGGGTTATELGVRSLTDSTSLADFNDGLGVEILSGGVDPVSGAPDPTLDLDFRVTTKDGTTFDVDLAGATTVGDVISAINTAAAGAGLVVGVDFEATYVATGNGIALADSTVGVTTTVTSLNGSHAAEDLGILGSSTGATLDGQDRATVAVDSALTHLMALRDALIDNDERGISLATSKLDLDINRAIGARADVGIRAQRVERARVREEDLLIQDTALKSEIQDLDFTEAAIKFATLQQQLQAGLSTAAQASSLSLMDFLR
jgi:flagellin-like hook-associated protein FlgL